MLRTELKALESHHGDPLVSIIAPMRKTFPGIKKNPVILKNMLKTVKEKLESRYDSKVADKFIKKFDKIEAELDYENMDAGIGIFIGEDFEKVLHLPFEPNEQAIVDTSFQVRDLVFTNNRVARYWVICVSEAPFRLIGGFGQTLHEVKNEDFPAEFIDPGKTGHHDPLKASRVDIDQIRDEHKKKFFRLADEKIAQFIRSEGELPVVLVGVKKNLSFFRSVADTNRFVIGEVEGNHVKGNLHELSELVWPVIEAHQKEKRDQALKALEESIGENKYVSGLQTSWEHSFRGRIDTLLVEKDYHCPAYLNEDRSKLYIEPSDKDKYTRIEDAVDDIIENVVRQNGKVIFLKEGRLNGHNKIAGVTRY